MRLGYGPDGARLLSVGSIAVVRQKRGGLEERFRGWKSGISSQRLQNSVTRKGTLKSTRKPW